MEKKHIIKIWKGYLKEKELLPTLPRGRRAAVWIKTPDREKAHRFNLWRAKEVRFDLIWNYGLQGSEVTIEEL